MEFVALFPGQGSQSAGMGKDFIDSSKELYEAADKALGFSISKLCFEGPEEDLTLTQNAQPAILLTSIVAFREAALNPKAAAGHSLGEYSALVAAGALGLEDALNLVHKRGRYMQEAVKPGAGKMLAVIGPSEEEIQAAIDKTETGIVEIANLNSPGQTVVAGDVSGVDGFSENIKAKKLVPLKVSAPFHCQLMAPAAEKLAVDLDAIEIKAPAFPVYANVDGEAQTTPDKIRENLKKQVCGSVRWTDCVLNMVKETEAKKSIEFGSGKVLSNLMKRIDSSVERAEITDRESLEKNS